MSAARRIGTLAQLLAAVVLAGVLVAGVLFPVVGGLGVTARDSASLLDALPVELTDRTPAGNTVMTAANGEPITGFYDENRAPVTSDRIAGVMKQAMVAIEDARFYSHNGLDVQGTLRAAVTNLAAGGVQEGGSTLTQQLVKQTLLQTADTPEEAAAATEQTLQRKLREARLALALEQTYSKDEILTRYLNIVYFGAERLRGAGRVPDLLLGGRRRPHAAAGGDAGRAGAEPHQRRPDGGPRGRHHPAQPGAGPDGRAGHGDPRGGRRRAGRAAHPGAGRGPAARVRAGRRRPVRLRLRAALPDPDPRPDPGPARARRPDHHRPRWTPSCSAPGTPRCWRPCRWATRWPGCSPPSSPAPGTCWR